MIWSMTDRWRAPVGDFPPRWATAWGDDEHGLWADLTVGEATQRLRWIEPTGPAGFWMGSPTEERNRITDPRVREHAHRTETEPRLVLVAEGFWLADTPCTQGFWREVMGANPSEFAGTRGASERPVESVTLGEVRAFIADLEACQPHIEGRAQLPTEVQWEYAARAGSQTAYPWGDLPLAGRGTWRPDGGATTVVRSWPPNAWGIYDMHGNVWERCTDAWRDRVTQKARGGDSGWWVLRGGSWHGAPADSRSASRLRGDSIARAPHLGFRFVLAGLRRTRNS